MIRPLTALAVVKKKNPRLNILQIYSKKDDPKIGKDEMLVKVIIMARSKD